MRPVRLLALVLVAGLLSVACATQPPSGGPLEEGEQAPGFKLPATGGRTVALADLRGRPVLLYFSMGPG